MPFVPIHLPHGPHARCDHAAYDDRDAEDLHDRRNPVQGMQHDGPGLHAEDELGSQHFDSLSLAGFLQPWPGGEPAAAPVGGIGLCGVAIASRSIFFDQER